MSVSKMAQSAEEFVRNVFLLRKANIDMKELVAISSNIRNAFIAHMIRNAFIAHMSAIDCMITEPGSLDRRIKYEIDENLDDLWITKKPRSYKNFWLDRKEMLNNGSLKMTLPRISMPP